MLGIVASVAPDIDLLWFYFVDARRHVHHAYWTHLPAFWLGVFAVVTAGLWLARATHREWLAFAIVAVNIMVHLALDSIAGGVEWLWPWRSSEFVLVHVPDSYSPWYFNFFLHWTFALELLLVGLAIFVYFAERGRQREDHGFRRPRSK
jgi:inner membrane protein